MLSSSKPLKDLTERELEALARYHETLADMWHQHQEYSMEKGARETALPYRNELERRRKAGSWEDPDR